MLVDMSHFSPPFCCLLILSPTLTYNIGFIFQFDSSRVLGTPTEEQWPGVTSLRDWHVYPRWEPQNLARAVPSLGPDGVDLLEVSITQWFMLVNS